jgi:hypothetical protein
LADNILKAPDQFIAAVMMKKINFFLVMETFKRSLSFYPLKESQNGMMLAQS